MNAIVLYVSRTGFTKRYAQWIAQALDCPALEESAAKPADLDGRDTVICGGWLNAEKVAGRKQFLQWRETYPEKRFFFFATGATPPEHQAYLQKVARESGLAPFFYLPGGLDYEAMGATDALKLKAFAKMLGTKAKKNSQMGRLAERISHSFDLSREEYIQPLVDAVKAE